MVRTISLLVLLAAALSASSQWTRQAPYPADHDLQAVFFISPEVGFISGDDSILMRTADGGQTWTQASETNRTAFGLGDSIWDIQFVDAANGYALGNPLRGYRTTDAGLTWQVIQTPAGVLGMDFVSPTDGIIFDRRSAFVTSNSGASWSEAIPDSLNHFIMDIDFLDADFGLAVGQIDNVLGVFRTDDFGETWQRINPQGFHRVMFLNENVILATLNSGFYRSTDGGVTWTYQGAAANPFSQTEIEAITKVSNTSAAAVSFDHSIWMTNDSGVTWSRVKEPTGVWGFELDIHFVTPQVGYSAGRGGLIYKTTDGGGTWTQISNGIARHMLDIKMLETGLGLAVGYDGAVVRTTDFGETWVASKMRGEGEGWHIGDLHTIEFIDEDTIVVGGQYGRVFRSEDAGLTWTQQLELGGNADVLDTFFINENEGWIAAILNAPRGSVEHTTDGGQTWTRLFDGDPYPTRLHMFNATDGLTLIRPYSQLRTNDGFSNFSVEGLSNEDQWVDMEFVGDSGWYGGVFGHIMRTTDRGQTRIETMLPGWQSPSDSLSDLDALSQTHILAATRRQSGLGSGRIYESINGGVTWSTLPAITTPYSSLASLVLAIDAFEAGPIWAASQLGYIFKFGEVFTPILPSAYTLVRGNVIAGGSLASVLQSDDERMMIRPAVTLGSAQDPVVVEFVATSPQIQASELRLLVESSATSSNIQVKTELFDYQTGKFVQVAAIPSTTADSTQTIVRNDTDRWISATGEVKFRISYRATGPVLAFPWTGRLDMIRWQVR